MGSKSCSVNQLPCFCFLYVSVDVIVKCQTSGASQRLHLSHHLLYICLVIVTVSAASRSIRARSNRAFCYLIFMCVYRLRVISLPSLLWLITSQEDNQLRREMECISASWFHIIVFNVCCDSVASHNNWKKNVTITFDNNWRGFVNVVYCRTSVFTRKCLVLKNVTATVMSSIFQLTYPVNCGPSSLIDLENTDRKHNILASERPKCYLFLTMCVCMRVCIQIVLKDHRTLIPGVFEKFQASLVKWMLYSHRVASDVWMT